MEEPNKSIIYKDTSELRIEISTKNYFQMYEIAICIKYVGFNTV